MKFIFYAFDTVWLFYCTALSVGLLFSVCRFKGVLISRSFPQSESFKAFPQYVSAYFALRKGVGAHTKLFKDFEGAAVRRRDL